MKVIAVNGITKSGKTTVCETIISGLTKLGYSVGSVKEIHFELFKIDPVETSNTNRHKDAGSKLVTARGMFETDILYQEMLPIEDILKHYDHDFVILEGVTDLNVPRIITAHCEEEVLERLDERVVGISGVLANDGRKSFADYPVIHALEEPEKLVQFVMQHAISPMPNMDPKCCGECGYTCREMTGRILKKQSKIEDCVLKNPSIELKIGGHNIEMVPFVENILKNAVLSVAKELNGYTSDGDIEITFKRGGKI